MAKATTPVQPNAALAGSPVAPQFMDRVAQPSSTLLRKQALKKGELDDDVVADAPEAQDDVIVLAQASTGAAAAASGGGSAAAAAPAVLGSLTMPQVLGMGAGALLAGAALSGGSDSPAAPLPSSNVAPQSSHVGISGIEAAAPSYTFTEAQLLSRATDANGDKLSVSGVQLAEGQTGSLVNNGDGTWTFTPAVNDDSSIELVYEVTDGRLSTDATATLDRSAATGEVQLLTAGQNNLVFDGFRTVDTVKGVIDYDLSMLVGVGVPLVQWDDNSTFTIGDSIQGNGFTKVELVVDASEHGALFFGEDASLDAPYVEMSGVDELVLKAAAQNDFSGSAEVYFHADTYGDDISTIRMQGVDGMSIHVHDLQADETLALHQETQGYLHVTGEWSGLDFDVTISDDGEQDVATASSVSLTEAVITVNAGKDQEIDLEIGLDTTEFAGSGDAVNGDVTLGDIVMVAEKSGEIDFSAENRAYANDQTSSENNAAVGDLTVGNVSLAMAKYADGHFIEFHQDATAEDGSATVTDMTLGNVSITGADHAAFEKFYLHQEADAYVEEGHDDETHAATVGNMVVGDITVSLGNGSVDNDDNEIQLLQEAYAAGDAVTPQDPQPDYVTVDAVIGDMTVGNISITAGDDLYNLDVYLSATAQADKGDARIGDLAVGQVDFTIGNGADGQIDFSVSRTATVDYTGDASVGNVLIADVTMNAGKSADLWAYVWQEASADKGNATVGDITVGNVSMTVGESAGASFEVSQTANAVSGDATLGNITIGDLSMSAGDGSNAWGEGVWSWLYQWGTVNGGDLTMGDYTVGDITMTAGNHAQAYVSLEMTGEAYGEDDTITIGDTKVGNVTVSAGSGTDVEAGWGLYLTADEADAYTESNMSTLGATTIGDVSISAGEDANLEFWNDIYGFDDIGDIRFGNIDLSVAEDGDLDYAYINVSANDSVGDVTLGDFTIDLGKNVDVRTTSDYFYVYGYNSIGDITVGNIDFSVATNTVSSTGLFYDMTFAAGSNSNTGDGVSIGNVSFGDITLSAVGTAFNSTCSGALNVSISVSSYGDIGNVAFGDVNLTASGDQAVADLYANVSASGDIGDVTIGNVTIAVDALDGSSAHAYATFTLGYYDGGDTIGNISVGDVGLSVNGSSADAGFYLYNQLSSSNAADAGSVTIGNITLAVSNTEDATDSADVYVYVTAHSDLTVGDVSLTQGAMDEWGANAGTDPSVWSEADMTADVSLISTYGDVTVGDITVTGGYLTIENLDDNDNFDQLGVDGEDFDSWMDLEADGTITVGDIDYSGYERYASIDVSAWEGAGNISVGDGGSYIWDNAGQNTITLGDGDDTVSLNTGNQGYDSADGVDVIVNFNGGDDSDVIELNLSDVLNEVDISDETFDNLDDFLAEAEGADEDLFVAKVGDDYYAAVDTDNGNAVDYVVRFEDVIGTLVESNFIA